MQQRLVRPGWIFVRRMYSTAAKLQEMEHFTCLNKEFRSDLQWWHTFFTDWNGVALLPPPRKPSLTVQTDASGSWGCAGILAARWFLFQWPQDWSPIAIMAKEIVPIVISCAIWGTHMHGRSVLFQCDNKGVVAAVNKGSSKEPIVMQLLRTLWFFVARFQVSLFIDHIPGMHNEAADMLSRNNMSQFFTSYPQANLLPTPLPQELLIVSVTAPDWTSPTFTQLFSTTTNEV